MSSEQKGEAPALYIVPSPEPEPPKAKAERAPAATVVPAKPLAIGAAEWASIAGSTLFYSTGPAGVAAGAGVAAATAAVAAGRRRSRDRKLSITRTRTSRTSAGGTGRAATGLSRGGGPLGGRGGGSAGRSGSGGALGRRSSSASGRSTGALRPGIGQAAGRKSASPSASRSVGTAPGRTGAGRGPLSALGRRSANGQRGGQSGGKGVRGRLGAGRRGGTSAVGQRGSAAGQRGSASAGQAGRRHGPAVRALRRMVGAPTSGVAGGGAAGRKGMSAATKAAQGIRQTKATGQAPTTWAGAWRQRAGRDWRKVAGSAGWLRRKATGGIKKPTGRHRRPGSGDGSIRRPKGAPNAAAPAPSSTSPARPSGGPARLTPTQKAGSTMSGMFPLAAHTAEFPGVVANWDPDGILEVVAAMHQMGPAWDDISISLNLLSAKAFEEFRMNPVIMNALGAVYQLQVAAADAMREIGPMIEAVHGEELERLRNPKPGDEKWDQRANR